MSPNAVDHGFHQTPLYNATGATPADAMKYRLSEDVSLNCPDAAERTSLNFAITSSRKEVARLLDHRAVNPNRVGGKPDPDHPGATHLTSSYRRGNLPHKLWLTAVMSLQGY